MTWKWLLAAMPLVFACDPAQSQGFEAGTWISRAPLPTPRQEMPHAVLDGKVYVTGGLDRIPTGSTLVEVFDPSTNSWETRAQMPFPLHHHSVAVVNGKLYVLGGYQRNTFNSTTHLFEYDPDADEWATLDPMPTSRGAHAVGVLGEKIYVTGGTSFGVTIGSVDVYDTESRTWSVAAPLLTPRKHHTAAVVDSILFIIGGRIPTIGNIASVEAYDPGTDSWAYRTSLPTARSGLASASLHGRIFVFGGEIPGVYTENEMYDPSTDTWETMAPMPTGRHGIGAAVVDDTIFVIGGAPNQGLGLTDVNEGFVPPASVLTRSEANDLPDTEFRMAVYPNPTSGRVTVRIFSDYFGLVSVALFDLLGRTVRSASVDVKAHSGTEIPIQTDGLPGGVYFVNVVVSTNPGDGGDRLVQTGFHALIVTGRL